MIKVMKKLLYFFVLALALLGIIGGIGYTIWQKAYVITIGIAALTFLAWPKIRDYFKILWP